MFHNDITMPSFLTVLLSYCDGTRGRRVSSMAAAYNLHTHMHIYRAWLATREKLDSVVQWGCRETLGQRGTRAHRDCKEMK